MTQDDIYHSKEKWYRYVKELDKFTELPEKRKNKGKYYCKNPKNMSFFEPLIKRFELTDLSYVRRLRLLNSFKLALYLTDKKLSDINSKDDRSEIDNIVIGARKILSNESMRNFIIDFKFMWKIIFPAVDHKGREDETQMPYVVRHLKYTQDKSKETAPQDRLEVEEYLKLIQALSDDKRIQCFCSLIYESLGRPQELAFRKISDVKLFKNYSKITLSSHGKEGVGILRCIDSNKYLLEWLKNHPQRDNPNAYLFPTLYGQNKNQPISMANVNKKLREVCKSINLNKPITCYSFKRNGVSDLRIRGTPDKEIQSRARWTSTKQLHTYDITSQEKVYRAELIRRGLIKPDKDEVEFAPITKTCPFCGAINGIKDKTCSSCTRLLWVEDIEKEQQEKDKEVAELKDSMALIMKKLALLDRGAKLEKKGRL